ncbi:MAG: response regulator, partial [Polyangia bacterium]
RAVVTEEPDLVLLDMMMPDVDGLQFLQRLPIECPGPLPPVIALSSVDAYREEALRRGAVAFLQKPIEVDVLFTAVRAALGGAMMPPDLAVHNRQDVIAAHERGDQLRAEIVALLDPTALAQVKARLGALTGWLQRYYGFGATFIQLLRGDTLRVEASGGDMASWARGFQYPRRLSWCDDVIDAGSTLLLCDPLHHPLPHFAQHPGINVGLRFYAGVPLTTWSGAVLGTLCLVDVEPHVLHAEDMRLFEALGLHVAHALEEIAGGVDADDFVLDANALFAADLLPLFAQIAVQRAARVGGTVGVAILRLADEDDADDATQAAYAAGRPGLVATRRAADEMALVAVGPNSSARETLREAVAACRDAVDIASVGSAWCGMTAGSIEYVSTSDSDLGARLIGLAADAYEPGSLAVHDPAHHRHAPM